MFNLKSLTFITLFPVSVVVACPVANNEEPPNSTALAISATSMDISQEKEQRTVATFGTIKNTANVCFDDVIIEVNYFDLNNKLVDTVVQSPYDMVVPATEEVSFRVLATAAKPKDSYVTQSVRILNAEPRFGRHNRTKKSSDTIKELAISLAPIVLLIAVWAFFIRRYQRKGSLMDQQITAINEQNRILERIATAIEIKTAGRDVH
jgi:ATP-dependent Zn protease